MMKPLFRVILALLSVVCLSLVAAPRPASAHPMGNFTINQYSALTVGPGCVSLFYVVDMAEIPTYSELGTIRADHSDKLTQAERDAYVARKSPELLKGLSLSLDGTELPLTVNSANVSFPPGAGGLPTLRFEMQISAPLGAQKGTLRYSDANFVERIGWKEVIANAGIGAKLLSSDVPTADRSNALHSYNPDLLQNPPRQSSAVLTFDAGGTAAGGCTSQGSAAAASTATPLHDDPFAALIGEQNLTLGFFLLALVLSFIFGAGHALSPGHGKTVVAAYLVGSRGTPWHAVILGLTVTVSHTIGVFILGFVVLYLAASVPPETIYPYLNFVSGFLIAVIGTVLFVQRYRTMRRANSLATAPAGAGHTHSHDEHEHSHDHDVHVHTHGDHDHGHSHEHDHAHSHENVRTFEPSNVLTTHSHGPFSRPHTHLPAEGQHTSMRNLLVLGITG